jgi:hypothetical protein
MAAAEAMKDPLRKGILQDEGPDIKGIKRRIKNNNKAKEEWCLKE